MNLYHLIADGMDQDIPDPDGFNAIASCLNIDLITLDDIIEVLNASELSAQNAPHIGNIHMDLLLGRICAVLINQGMDCGYFINALDTHLYVEGEEIHCLEDLACLVDRDL